MDSTEARVSGKFPFWPGIWIPLAVFITGLMATAIFADMAEVQARSRSEAIHQAGHRLLVQTLRSAMAAHAQGAGTPEHDWLDTLFDTAVPPELGLRIDALDRHSKRPLLQIRTNTDVDPALALRTEVSYGDDRWMLTSLPLPALNTAASASNSVWVAGALLSVLAAMPPLLLCRRLNTQARRIRKLERLTGNSGQLISNLRVEKDIIRQALNDSEARNRDLIALSGAIICELDESGHIGFVSPQVADLLNLAPTDLTGQDFETLVEPCSRENYRLTLQAARADRGVERIDLNLIGTRGAQTVPVTLRIRALDDPLHGLAGYRMSALPNPAA